MKFLVLITFIFFSSCFIVFRRGNLRSSTTEKMKIASSSTAAEIPISINDIEDLLANIPTTTRRAKPTTISTTTTTVRPKPTTPAASGNDDLDFLRQVVRVKNPEKFFFCFRLHNNQLLIVCNGGLCANTRSLDAFTMFHFLFLIFFMSLSLSVIRFHLMCTLRVQFSATSSAASNINPNANSNEIDYVNFRNEHQLAHHHHQHTKPGNLHCIEK